MLKVKLHLVLKQMHVRYHEGREFELLGDIFGDDDAVDRSVLADGVFDPPHIVGELPDRPIPGWKPFLARTQRNCPIRPWRGYRSVIVDALTTRWVDIEAKPSASDIDCVHVRGVPLIVIAANLGPTRRKPQRDRTLELLKSVAFS